MSEVTGTLNERLNLIDEPLQKIIRRHLEGDTVENAVVGFYSKFGLTKEQLGLLSTECKILLCQVSTLDEFKDNLIAEVGLSYEVAVRIQRAFEREVLDPITKEAEAQGYSPTSPPPVIPQDATPNRNRILYEDERFRVTYSTLVMGGATFPISKISRIVRPFQGMGLFGIPGLLPSGWILVVTLADGEDLTLERKKKEQIEALYAALEEAIENAA